jgi:ABC-type transport system involved in cytochrome c biogenesis permease subunit
MMLEIWLVVSALLLGLAAIAGGLAIFQERRLWDLIAVGTRTAGTVALAVSLSLAVIAEGAWSPFDWRQMLLSIVLVTLAIHLILSWRFRAGNGGPVVDLLALVLVLLAIFVVRPGVSPQTCVQGAWPFQIQWILYLLGSGAVLAAGSASLTLALRRGLGQRARDLRASNRAALYNMLLEAIVWGLVALGSGLTVGVWWAWRALGSVTSGDPREAWMAITWLVAAMSLLAWQLETRRGRWAAGLAVAATTCMLFGLLFVTGLRQIVGV